MTVQTKKIVPLGKSKIDPNTILGFYDLGSFAQRQYQRANKSHSGQNTPGVALDVAEQFGVHRTLVDSARTFAGKFALSEARKLAKMQMADGKSLSRRHVIALLSLDSDEALNLAEICCRHGWSARRLESELKSRRPRKMNAGRKPQAPSTKRQWYVQMADVCQRWLHWYQSQDDERVAVFSATTDRALHKRLDQVETSLEQIVAIAEQRLRRSR